MITPARKDEVCKEGLYFIRCKKRPDYFLCLEELSMLVFRKHGFSQTILVLDEKDIDESIADLKKSLPVVAVWIEETSDLEIEFCKDFEKVKTIDALLFG